jgi:hypothetical protein
MSPSALSGNPGRCQCGNVSVCINLPTDLESHAARRCDCDFCTHRGICYLSHPDGALEINAAKPLEHLQQGSNQARFLNCPGCDSVVAVVLALEEGLQGALNANLLDDQNRLQEAVTVSPKHLDPDQKRLRWSGVWCAVKINGKKHL